MAFINCIVYNGSFCTWRRVLDELERSAPEFYRNFLGCHQKVSMLFSHVDYEATFVLCQEPSLLDLINIFTQRLSL